MQEIVLKRGKDRRLRKGHLWVFNNEIETNIRDFEPGSLVDVNDANGKFRGRGYINPHSLISVRILTRRIQEIDAHFIKRRLNSCLEYRRALYPQKETFRLVHSEGDFLPGLIVDKYEDHLVLQANTVGMDRLVPVVVQSLDELLKPRVIIARNDSKSREAESLPCQREVLKGEPDPELVVVLGALRFRVDTLYGQKTGLFLDQAENYARLAEFTRSARALDCFCYTGGWALHAAHYGASEVLGIDSSDYALERARFSMIQNDISNCEFRAADAFQALAEFDRSGEKFDLVILDPPAFAKSRTNLTEAIRAYKQINLRAMRVLNPGGVLVTCSCSYRVSREIFLDMLKRAAADAGRLFRILEYRTQARDHPILLPVDETEYLKCVILRVV
jgi:23S rRNA (cytosine1962-C5)-methyltransferase